MDTETIIILSIQSVTFILGIALMIYRSGRQTAGVDACIKSIATDIASLKTATAEIKSATQKLVDLCERVDRIERRVDTHIDTAALVAAAKANQPRDGGSV